MPNIPEHIIDRIRDSVDIVELIGRYVSLKKSGQNYFGLCPFHQEKTPSFSVNPARQIFHCFGCGEGGNAITFLMKYEKIGFVDAVKRLADEVGIEIPVSQQVKRQQSENETLYHANNIACTYFQQQLQKAPDSVLNYLQERNITAETVKEFRLGYAPPGWDGLIQYIRRFGYSLKPYQKLGLIIENEKKTSFYDRFRNRLMFPIMNQSGKIAGFGGRALGDEPNTPKYINSPESPIYRKSHILFGLNLTYPAIRAEDRIILVEGYMDAIQLYQNGIRNVVATSGTALTESHAQLIRRYTNNVILCYDADNAGIQAAVRGGEILFQNLLEVKVVLLPSGSDPDSYVKENGKEAFLTLLKEGQDYLTFRIQQLAKQYNLQSAAERSRAVEEMVTLLTPVKDDIRLDFYLEKTAEQMHVPSTLLLNEIRKRRRSEKERVNKKLASKTASEGGTPGPSLTFTGAVGAEKDLILLLINFFEEIQEYVYSHVEADDFQNPEFRHLFLLIQEKGKSNPSSLLHIVLEDVENDALRSLLIREVDVVNRDFKKPDVHLKGCIKRLKMARLQSQIDVTRRKLEGIAPDDPQYLTLLQSLQETIQELKKWQDVQV
ncbi:MAG: DNA primase [Calditrichaeota bacterium]|nr:MAG: DNA primase [Calditrichota bacterium]